jgi:hypothetical protein
MSYRCGIGEALARQLGMEAGDPRLVCDGCGATSTEGRAGMNRRSGFSTADTRPDGRVGAPGMNTAA